MNREIEFRGKRKDNGEWIYGGYMKNNNGIYITDTTNYHLNASYKNYIVFSETIGQYTGLKDKNGKKIFEGDIVETYEYLKPGEVYLRYKVEYIERLAKFVLNPIIVNGKFDNNNHECDIYFYDSSNIEVIGTIFDKEKNEKN